VFIFSTVSLQLDHRWAFKIILITIVPYFMIFAAISTIPDKFPVDEKKIVKEGIDPDTLTLTPKELGHRMSYDARNEPIHLRRSTISKTMADLGLRISEEEQQRESVRNELTPGQRRLSAMVLGQPVGAIDIASAAKIVADAHGADESAHSEAKPITLLAGEFHPVEEEPEE